MKFGKQLLSQCVEEWMPYYLNYKKLKGQIKRVVAAQQNQMRRTYGGPEVQGEKEKSKKEFLSKLKSVDEERKDFSK